MTEMREKRRYRKKPEPLPPVPKLDVGDFDPMSKLARQHGLPLCGRRGCTRAAGHAEGDRSRSFASQHVVAGAGFVAQEVFQ